MSFKSLSRESYVPQRLLSLARRLRVPWRGPARSTLRLVLAVVVVVPFVAVWVRPENLPYAAAALGAVWFIGCYRQWAGWQHAGSYVAGASTLAVFWSSIFLVWLFLENDLYRVLLLITVVAVSWWYLGEWQRVRATLFAGEAGAGASPTLTVGFISSFCLTASAESFLVYLSTRVWVLVLACFLPIMFLLVAFIYSSGWSLMKRVAYVATGGLILLQVFLLGLWWPTSSYVIGFTVAIAFTVVALALRQEAQGFINRRSFTRELVVTIAAWFMVLLGARWLS